MGQVPGTPLAYVLSTFSIVLLACGSTQPALRDQSLEALSSSAATSDQEELASGSSAHSAEAGNSDIVFVSQDTSDCDAAHIECFRSCWKKKPPRPFEYHKRDHYRYCETRCFNEYMACLKRKELHLREFPTMDRAMDWLRRHKKEILIGTIVVVAGATFIVVTGGAGALVLVPLAAM
jgi:hypothetical protein